MLIKISSELYVNDEEIKYIVPVNSNAAMIVMQDAKKDDRILRFTKGKPARTLICLRDNQIILTNITITTLTKKTRSSDAEESQ